MNLRTGMRGDNGDYTGMHLMTVLAFMWSPDYNFLSVYLGRRGREREQLTFMNLDDDSRATTRGFKNWTDSPPHGMNVQP